jgi:TatD DNase family protein
VSFFDVMAHVDDPRVQDPDAVLARAAAAQVTHIVTAGVDPLNVPEPRWRALPVGLTLLRAYGVHPMAIDAFMVTAQLDALPALLQGAAAIGEIGLDQRPGMPPLGLQETVLRTQLQLAVHLELPVILHAVRAGAQLLAVLQDFKLPRGGLLHGFAGPAELVRPLAKRGLYFSFGALLTNPAAERCHRAAATVPVERLLLESDTPEHGMEPAALPRLLEALCAARGSVVSAQQIAHNARELFCP